MKTENLWVAIHHHDHGIDVGLFRAEKEPEESAIVKALDWSFEPEREEYIETWAVTKSDIPTIKV